MPHSINVCEFGEWVGRTSESAINTACALHQLAQRVTTGRPILLVERECRRQRHRLRGYANSCRAPRGHFSVVVAEPPLRGRTIMMHAEFLTRCFASCILRVPGSGPQNNAEHNSKPGRRRRRPPESRIDRSANISLTGLSPCHPPLCQNTTARSRRVTTQHCPMVGELGISVFARELGSWIRLCGRIAPAFSAQTRQQIPRRFASLHDNSVGWWL